MSGSSRSLFARTKLTSPLSLTHRQVLLMNPAPIIGLSATVGDPERFSNWLGSVEESCGRKYSLVQQ